jgi:hypothetical protein
VGKLLIPHPAVINWLLRRALFDKAWHEMSFSYEMGHFQAAPRNVLYATAILTGTFTAGRFNLPEVLFVLVGIQAVWEMLSAALTIIDNTPYYHRCYRGIPKLPRITFRTATGILTAGAWFIAFA